MTMKEVKQNITTKRIAGKILDYRIPKSFLYDVKVPFPVKLHEMLEIMASAGLESIVSWSPHGKAFRVHKPKEFTDKVMPRFFKQSKYKSFMRQLHIYGFQRIATKGMKDFGAYYHELFIRNQKDLSWSMRRQRCKSMDGRSANHFTDPNFYDENDEEKEGKKDQGLISEVVFKENSFSSTNPFGEDCHKITASEKIEPKESTLYAQYDHEKKTNNNNKIIDDEDLLMISFIGHGNVHPLLRTFHQQQPQKCYSPNTTSLLDRGVKQKHGITCNVADDFSRNKATKYHSSRATTTSTNTSNIAMVDSVANIISGQCASTVLWTPTSSNEYNYNEYHNHSAILYDFGQILTTSSLHSKNAAFDSMFDDKKEDDVDLLECNADVSYFAGKRFFVV